jgi:hypothetical protein
LIVVGSPESVVMSQSEQIAVGIVCRFVVVFVELSQQR